MPWDVDFKPNLLKCELREQRILTEIHFRINSRQVVFGETESFVIHDNGTKRFVSREALFDIGYSQGLIIGHTGDPRGNVDDFSLVRKTKKDNGPWEYTRTESHGYSIRVEFNCKYKKASKE